MPFNGAVAGTAFGTVSSVSLGASAALETGYRRGGTAATVTAANTAGVSEPVRHALLRLRARKPHRNGHRLFAVSCFVGI